MPHELIAGCGGGPCPDLTRDRERGLIGGQGYIPPAEALSPDLPETPPGEVRWEMRPEVFVDLLARFLTDEELDAIHARRREAVPT